MERKPVDIVVPVYNGYDDLLSCVESLRLYTDLSLDRVILIDDASPDERIWPFLKELSSEKGFTAIRNEKNRGFSANVNKGLAFSSNDTILLNSDTRVTKGWVGKLQRCAMSSERIATVTPLSNAATLASVPVPFRDNPVPQGYSVDSYAELVEEKSLKRYPRITVAVGFCMYVKQEAYLAAGPFDEKTFQRGYGEENDFCNRLGMLGYIHVLCDDTFIYHRGTGSFDSEEKKKLLEEHTKILKERYPAQMKENDIYSASNPNQDLCDNLNLYAALNNGRKNILYFLHLDFRDAATKNTGGTQLHVRDLVEGLREKYNLFVLAREGDYICLTAYCGKSAVSGPREFSFRFYSKEEAWPVMRDEKEAELLRKILVNFRISLVHLHHSQGFSLEIFHLCRELGIPLAATLHDYYYACPTIKLLRDDGLFCPAEGTFLNTADEECKGCLLKNCSIRADNYLTRWRFCCLDALSNCSLIIFPSQSAMDLMLSVYPSLKDRSRVIGHGTDAMQAETSVIRFFKGKGKSQGRALIKTNKVHSRLDRQPGRDGGFSYLAGWAYLEDVDSSSSDIILLISDSRKKAHFIRPRKNARPDLASALADDRYLWGGIHTVFDIPDFPDGSYTVRIIIEHDKKLYTDGKLYRGSYKKAKELFNVAFLGGVTKAKGSSLINGMINSENPDFNFYIFGEIGDGDVSVPKDTSQVFFSGIYRREDIGSLLKAAKIQLVVIAPVWAETFCYTLSEAWACGIPVVGTDIGAVGERIRESGAGFLIPPDADEKKLLALLERLKDNPGELEEKKKRVKALKLKDLPSMNREYEAVYEELMKMSDKKAEGFNESLYEDDARLRDEIFQAYALANPSVRGSYGEARINAMREENEKLRSYLEILENTSSYRFARKLSEADIPFKEQLKKLLKKIP